MQYIIGAVIEIPVKNHRFVDAGFKPGQIYKIVNIRFNRATRQIDYSFTDGILLSFATPGEADNYFDRMQGVIRPAISTEDVLAVLA